MFEVLVVVAIITLISTAVGIAAVRYWHRARVQTTENDARTIRGAVKTWWLEHESGACPSVDDLVAGGALERETSAGTDAWGSAWALECSGDDVVVTSRGPDMKSGTADDIRVPPT